MNFKSNLSIMDSSITIYPNVLNDSCPSYLTNEFLIDIPVVCIKCKKYGHHAKECGKKEKVKKERTKMKQDNRHKTSDHTRLNDRSKISKTRNKRD